MDRIRNTYMTGLIKISRLNNKIKTALFSVDKISMNNNNIYKFYILMKICMCLHSKYFINKLDKKIGEGLIDTYIITINRKFKIIFDGKLSDMITHLNKNKKKLYKQNKMPNRYIIHNCSIKEQENLHKLFYSYYDPDNIFHNTFHNIFETNNISYNLTDNIEFEIFNNFKIETITLKLNDIIHYPVNFINELI